jgi:hypothetical protein
MKVRQTQHMMSSKMETIPFTKKQTVQEFVNRTWDMLEREGFIKPSLSMNGQYGWRQLSENGLKIARGEDLLHLKLSSDIRRR